MKKYDVIIIGAGVIGLSIAYNLGLKGCRSILVIEKKYISYGASGRCGGGIRQQWSTEENILLAKGSVEIFKRLSKELGINIWFRQGGYLFLSYNMDEYEKLKRAVKLQNSLGVNSILMNKGEIEKKYNYLNTDRVVGATFCPTDGTLFPFPVLWGYAERIRDMNITINEFEEVTGIKHDKKEYTIITNKNSYESDWVINAAGAWSSHIAALANIKLNNVPYRHEILVTEPIKKFMDPMIVSLKNGLYMSQTMRGEVIGGYGLAEKAMDFSMKSTTKFLKGVSHNFISMIPRLSEVRVLRQWAGLYDESPDGKPVIGEEEQHPKFMEVNGLGGHGFMLAPKIGEVVAEHICNEKEDIDLNKFTTSRFKKEISEKESFSLG
ncbi:MAG: FAD-binding oxidoreductase [Candidatus Thermoplasmatota archaeon]|jgi:sarcosine oxidase subunit beta|nr:FAD-binding oxidoreductase [Candidatus Thermoplasmatota archaeon]MCL5963814.1 FAD-binding oxidoreductase [Candidatus Thermoplasmatota archaeon]